MYIELFFEKIFFYTLVRIFLNSVHTHTQNKTKTFPSLQSFRESVPKTKQNNKKKTPQIRYLN